MLYHCRRSKYWQVILPSAFAAVLIAILWTVTFHQLSQFKEKYLIATTKNADSFAQAFEAHTISTIEVADQAVQFLKYEYETFGKQLDIRQFLSSHIFRKMFNFLSVIDEQSNVVLSSQSSGEVKRQNVESVRLQSKDDAENLLLSEPFRSLVTGKSEFFLTRRINKADGSFNGAVVASMDPLYFTRLFSAVNLGKHSSIALIDPEGVVLAWRSADSEVVGKKIANLSLFKQMGQQKIGNFRAKSEVDGLDRIFSYRKLEKYPLFVVVGIGVEDELIPFNSTYRQVMTLATLFTFVIMIVTGLIIFLIRHLTLHEVEAESANRAKTLFLSNMSHELRTPLNGILGYAELLKEDLVDAQQRSFAQYVHESGMHLLLLVNSLLFLGKIEAGEVDLNMKYENLRALLARAVNAHISSATAKNITISLSIAPNVPDEIQCDHMRVVQVLNNLFHNAIKFTDSGEIGLKVTAERQSVKFSMTDTGAGIPIEYQGAIFEKFFQVNGTEQPTHEGSGLGLAIVSQLVELMGGIIILISTPGVGTTVSFTVPLKHIRARSNRIDRLATKSYPA